MRGYFVLLLNFQLLMRVSSLERIIQKCLGELRKPKQGGIAAEFDKGDGLWCDLILLV